MKFFHYFGGRWTPMIPELVTGRAHIELARAAEDAGYYGVCLDEHPAPVESWLSAPGGHHCLDPFIALAAVAGATEKLRLLTYLAVLPYRTPFMFAKAATTLDVVSDGRAILGVGVGYMRGEFEALGVDFEARNAAFDEVMDVFQKASAGEPVSYQGSHFTADQVTIRPSAVQRPHPPIWIGGNSKLSRRRAASYGQGWCPMPQARGSDRHKTPPLESLEDLQGLIAELRSMEREAGRRAPLDIIMSSVITQPAEPFAVQLDNVRRLQDLGVTHLTVNGVGETVSQARDHILRYGDEVIARCG